MSKLQDLADALAKAGVEDAQIIDHTTYVAGVEQQREVRVMRGGQTAGYLTETSSGRFSFAAPDDAAFNDVSPIAAVLAEESVKLGGSDV